MAAWSDDAVASVSLPARARARSIVSGPFNKVSDCGAVVLESRREQVSIESGASNTSIIGIRNVRFWIMYKLRRRYSEVSVVSTQASSGRCVSVAFSSGVNGGTTGRPPRFGFKAPVACSNESRSSSAFKRRREK